ncbi:MAG: Gfo/Idh/MocA family oxidoreductase [Victivallaceae bacterium]|nr:Gfo/Idh/MocA family oxidoreductase [Victivallaceae bacterium]
MAEKIKWGVIGCGGIAARRTIPEFKKMCTHGELVAVMDINPETAAKVAAQFEIPHYCATEQELLQHDISAVYIATPQNVHCAQVVRAAEAGKHILCEKPMAITLVEVKIMEKAIRKNGVKFMLGFCMRNNVYNKKAREIVHSGVLGQIIMGRAELTGWYPLIVGAWRQDISISHGGALIDMGTHCLDLLEWIMNAKITEVGGFQDLMTHKYPTPIEDASTIVLRFSNGAHGIVDNYFNLPDATAQNILELHGTRGSIIGQGTIGQDSTGKMFSIIQKKEVGYDANQIRNIEVPKEEYVFEGIGLYGQMLDIFSSCILEDKESPITLEDGRHSVAVVNAIYKAVKEKKIVKVKD